MAIFERPIAQLKRPTVRSRRPRGKGASTARATGAASTTKMKGTSAVKAIGVDSHISERGIASVAIAANTKGVLRFMVYHIILWPQREETVGTWIPEATEALAFADVCELLPLGECSHSKVEPPA
jgi:hypothetical protein